MSLLFRYVARGNILLMLPTLAVGMGLYVLTDLFERIENFIEAGLSFGMVVTYFVVKMPLVISQILPVIFLLSTVIQLCIMARSRELVALQAGGISLAVLGRILLVCGLMWGGVQLCFSEVLGVAGERESARIWQEEVRKRNLAASVLTDVWFTENDWVISVQTLNPDNTGTGFTGYELSPDGLNMRRMILAQTYVAKPLDWTLQDVTIYEPAAYGSTHENVMNLALKQDPQTFRLVKPGSKPQQLPLWQLGDVIDRLTDSGSNVESLRTAWHMKLAYAASLVVMALVATALVMCTTNIFIATALALLCTFVYYALFTVGTSLGQRGVLDPVLGAWMANGLATFLACCKLLPLMVPRLRKLF